MTDPYSDEEIGGLGSGPRYPGQCRHCDCPWNSCLIHTEFYCDVCSHPDKEPTE